MPEKLSIAKKIKIIRLNMGWSQSELAEYIHRTVGTVSQYEAGELMPPGDILDMIYDLKSKIKHVTVNF